MYNSEKNRSSSITPTVVIRGIVDRVAFRNDENGYSVIFITPEDLTLPSPEEKAPTLASDSKSPKTLVATGIAPQVKPGSNVILSGYFTVHPKFGRQFSIISLAETAPTTVEGLERYLGSGLIKGIGTGTAKRIVKSFGTDVLSVIKSNPEKIAALAGVGRKKADLLYAAVAQQGDFDQVLRFLTEHDISSTLAAKIYHRFQERTLKILETDPYALAREVRGIGFHTADSIAIKLGIAPDASLRLKAGIICALNEACDEGHCYLSKRSLVDRARLLLGLEEPPDLLEEITALITNGDIRLYRDGVFLANFYDAEERVAHFISDRAERTLCTEDRSKDLEHAINDAQLALGVTLSAEQRYAVELADAKSLLIITGGPGCGKTTMVRALTQMFQHSGRRYALAAPTGKAAQRLSQVCGATASTIHRLLRYDPFSKGFVHNAQNPLELDALIVDEASMIDILLARDLVAAISQGCKLILVGDKDQLPSVGPGRVFADLIRSPHVATIQLSQLFRREAESRINSVAHLINIGELPEIPTPDGIMKSDAYLIERRSIEDSANLIESLVAEQIPRKFGFSGADIAILTPTNRGPLGTIELNRRLQERLNPRDKHSKLSLLEIGDASFRVGDRVCQRSNNYKIDPAGVFNGDMGTVAEVNQEDQSITVELWDGRLIQYSRGDIGQLSLAYTITVHRSQGMEVPCVVLALDESHFTLLERQLIYTGVTRAKKLLIIVGSKRALGIATKRMQTKKRGTMLVERIDELAA
jgi:exodeoxyribonuclease V alpha subunit